MPIQWRDRAPKDVCRLRDTPGPRGCADANSARYSLWSLIDRTRTRVGSEALPKRLLNPAHRIDDILALQRAHQALGAELHVYRKALDAAADEVERYLHLTWQLPGDMPPMARLRKSAPDSSGKLADSHAPNSLQTTVRTRSWHGVISQFSYALAHNLDEISNATTLPQETNNLMPATGNYGRVARNSVYGPGYASVDLSVFKNIPLPNQLRAQVRLETFTILTRVNLAQPGSRIGGGLGRIGDTIGDSRGPRASGRANRSTCSSR